MFEWTTPTRRRGSRILSPIPHEVYLEIYSYLEPSDKTSPADSMRILSDLARVCRFFSAVSISRIYRSLEFSGQQPNTTYGRFCKLLLQSAHSSAEQGEETQFAADIAPFVRECTFRDWSSDRARVPFASAFLERDARAVRLMPNVETMTIEYTPISRTLLSTAVKAKQTLKTLRLRSCTLDDDELTKSQLIGLSSLTLHTLEFFSSSSSSSSCFPPSAIPLRNLSTFKTNTWPFGLYFLKRKHPYLRVLELHNIEDVPALINFLNKSPSITDLTIASVQLKLGGGAAGSLSLDAMALHDLTALSIPSCLLSAFSAGGGRALQKLALTGTETRYFQDAAGVNADILHFPTLPRLTVKDIAFLVPMADSLTELQIPQHVYFALPLFKHFRGLRVLVLVYDHLNFETDSVVETTEQFRDAIIDLCTKWPPPSPSSHPLPLRELRLEFSHSPSSSSSTSIRANPHLWDLQLQLELLSTPLTQTFPLLLSARFAAFVQWQRWDPSAGSEWNAYVPWEMRAWVRGELGRGRQYTDVGGVFGELDYL
ncbi:RING-type domain-containing protein [Favolaschia claudopus]|uniref:RING-type domain-containing protein n=1 Tax=Favolaschia claudopus TaxID=2862362 RepID=A0AAW0DFT0_9AGAR